MKAKFLIVGILSLPFISNCWAGQLEISGKSEFIATGKPGFIKIDGVGSGLTGQLQVTGNQVSGQASFPLNALDTGVSLRDKHMKEEYLEVQKYPTAQLTIAKMKFAESPVNNGFNQSQVPFSGVLTVHGVSHPVNGTIDVTSAAGITKGDANFGIKISDFGFPEPKFMGMKVNDDVQVKIHLEAKGA